VNELAPFLSFERLLRKYLRLMKPKRILEWGVGHSTRIMVEECPSSTIDSIEHHSYWFHKYQETLKTYPNKVNLYYVPLDKGYATFPCQKYDLIFIDGRRRVECMQTSKRVVSKAGVVILHDSERERYATGKALFTLIEESDGTAVMKP
jgi:predicted O-methyltransferase YrrM